MELRTDRLVLRDFLPSDAGRLIEYQADPRYLQHYDEASPAISAHELVDMFCRWAAESPRTKYQLAITFEGRVIGTCGIRKEAAGDDHAEFGCELDPESWNAGFAREAGKAMLNFGFTVLGVQRILARTLATNSRAIALATSLGFQRVEDGLYVARFRA